MRTIDKQSSTLVLLALATTLGLSACVKVQVKPKEIVSDTVTAGKSLYQTIKRKKDGTEERLYSHTVDISNDQTDADAGIQCLKYLKEIAQAATENDAEFIKESTQIENDDTKRSIICELNAVV